MVIGEVFVHCGVVISLRILLFVIFLVFKVLVDAIVGHGIYFLYHSIRDL